MCAPFTRLDLPRDEGLSLLRQHAEKLYLVGGVARDALLAQFENTRQPTPQDFDLATPNALEPLQQALSALPKLGFRDHTTERTRRHNVLKLARGSQRYDIARFRRDIKTDGRFAHVEPVTDWREDAQRRDLTINALYVDGEGRVLDAFGGIEDLRKGIIRVIGEPRLRFAQDQVRVLRVYRYFARFGRQDLDEKLRASLRQAALDQLSGARVGNELRALLTLPNAAKALALMQQDGVLELLHKGLRFDAELWARNQARQPSASDALALLCRREEDIDSVFRALQFRKSSSLKRLHVQ